MDETQYLSQGENGKKLRESIEQSKETEKDFNIAFHNPKGEVIGKLYIQNDVMKFEGEAEESAKVFFDHVIKQYLTKKQK